MKHLFVDSIFLQITLLVDIYDTIFSRIDEILNTKLCEKTPLSKTLW